jgi:hypothetical protein
VCSYANHSISHITGHVKEARNKIFVRHSQLVLIYTSPTHNFKTTSFPTTLRHVA